MFFIDFHVDTLLRLYLLKIGGDDSESLYQNNGHVDLKRLIKSNYLAQMFACYVDLGKESITDSYFNDALEMIKLFHGEIRGYGDEVVLAKSYNEYLDNKKEGRLSAFLTIEEGGILDNDLNRLDILYDKGVRAITLTWNYENSIGFPNYEFKNQNMGLKSFGIETVERMDNLGIIVDVSHLSDGGFHDVYKHGKRPFMATHSNSRSICDHSRNLTDDMIKKLADKGGITGINFYGGFLQEDEKSTTESMLRHIRHIIKVGGRDVVGIGTDFDGMDGELEIGGAQDMPKLIEAMEKSRFSTNEIEAVCYRNAEDFYKRYWGA